MSRLHYFLHVTPCTYFIRESLNGLVMRRPFLSALLIAPYNSRCRVVFNNLSHKSLPVWS